MTSTEPRPRHQLCQALSALSYSRPRVTLFLGSDQYITHEARVALTPRHLKALRQDLAACGLELEMLVLAGAGDRAGFGDRDYEQVGARIVRRSEVSAVGGVDVFHSLKEPTAYESEIPGPFMRIGALHLASYPPGVGSMLAQRNFAAILDGGTIGNCSYLCVGGDSTPIVASMSRFAGAVSGLKLVAGLQEAGCEPGKMVVVGGGVAGLSAIGKLRPMTTHLVVVDPHPRARERLPAAVRALGYEDFEIIPQLTDEAVTDAVGIVFAHRSGARAAEKVCTIEQIRMMKPCAGIADIAIDQGGSIDHPDYCDDDDAATARKKYQQLLKENVYYAETNMPREEPRAASEEHGDASLPYVTALLALCALHGGPQAAAEELLRRDVRVYGPGEERPRSTILDCFLQDLRNGVQLAVRNGEVLITNPDVESNPCLVRWIRSNSAS